MQPDQDLSDPDGFPTAGVAYGGNDLRAVRWPPWLIGALLAGSATWLLAWITAGDPFAATVAGVAVTLVVPFLPLKLRSYVRPQPSPLRVDPSGLFVYLGNKSWWCAGSYLHLPWHVITEMAITSLRTEAAAVRISLEDRAGGTLDGVEGEVGRSLRATGTAVVSAVPAARLDDAVRHYSRSRCRVVTRR